LVGSAQLLPGRDIKQAGAGVNPPRTLKMTSLDRFSVNALKGGREVRYTGLALGVSNYPANVGLPGAGRADLVPAGRT